MQFARVLCYMACTRVETFAWSRGFLSVEPLVDKTHIADCERAERFRRDIEVAGENTFAGNRAT